MAGQGFDGKDQLEFIDIQDWVVSGWGEASKATLDDFEWDGDAVVWVGITLSPDNGKIVEGKMFLQGELLKSAKEIRATKLWDQADKDLRLSYTFEDSSIFTFNAGSMAGDYIDCSNLSWQVVERGNNTNPLEVGEYIEKGIEEFCVRPFVVPLSPEKAKLKVLIYPVSKVSPLITLTTPTLPSLAWSCSVSSSLCSPRAGWWGVRTGGALSYL